MRRDEFEAINEKTKKGNKIVIIVAVAALCITGILYAVKLQSESRYVTLNTGNDEISAQDTFYDAV